MFPLPSIINAYQDIAQLWINCRTSVQLQTVCRLLSVSAYSPRSKEHRTNLNSNSIHFHLMRQWPWFYFRFHFPFPDLVKYCNFLSIPTVHSMEFFSDNGPLMTISQQQGFHCCTGSFIITDSLLTKEAKDNQNHTSRKIPMICFTIWRSRSSTTCTM